MIGSGRDRRRVRQRLRRAGRRGRADLLARPGAARRGRRRGAGPGGRLRAPRPDRAVPVPGAGGPPRRGPGHGDADRRPYGHRIALPAGRRLDPQHRRHGPGRGRVSRWTRAASSRSTGCRAPRCAASTPPATAPGSSCWPRWRPCRAGSRCGTRSETGWSRSTSRSVSANVFTAPEIATVGMSQDQADVAVPKVATVNLPLATNARAKMQGFHDGFVKVFCLPVTGHHRRRGGGRPAGQRVDLPARHRGRPTGSPSTTWPARSRCTPRSPARWPRPPADCTCTVARCWPRFS